MRSPPGSTRRGRVRAGRRRAPPACTSSPRTARTVLDLVRGGLAGRARGRRGRPRRNPAVPLDQVRLLPPLQPPTVRDFVAFEEHVEGVVKASATAPGSSPSGTRRRRSTSPTRTRWSARTTTSPSPRASQLLDFELEVAVVVGRDGALADPGERARPHLRLHDPQRLVGARPAAPGDEGQPRPGQGQGLGHARSARGWSPPTSSSPTATPTASSPSTCGCRSTGPRSARTCCPTWAGRSRSSSPTPPAAPRCAPATCSAPAPAATAAAWPSCGAGAGEQDPPPLQPGDVVEMTVEGIGTIRNRVVAGPRPAAGRARPSATAGPGSACREAGRRQGRRRHRRRAGAGRRRGAPARCRGRHGDRLRPHATSPPRTCPAWSTGSST